MGAVGLTFWDSSLERGLSVECFSERIKYQPQHLAGTTGSCPLSTSDHTLLNEGRPNKTFGKRYGISAPGHAQGQTPTLWCILAKKLQLNNILGKEYDIPASEPNPATIYSLEDMFRNQYRGVKLCPITCTPYGKPSPDSFSCFQQRSVCTELTALNNTN